MICCFYEITRVKRKIKTEIDDREDTNKKNKRKMRIEAVYTYRKERENKGRRSVNKEIAKRCEIGS